MKISIIITIYNKENTLIASIQSAINQTYENVEIVIVNDGSTDNSLRLLKKLQAQYPNIVLIEQANMGLSEARNSGIRAATGDYLIFHDGDDQLERTALQNLARYANRYKSDIVGGIFRKVETSGEKVLNTFKEELIAADFSLNDNLAEKYATNFSSCNKIFNRIFLLENSLMFTPGLYMQDIEFWLKCMFLSKNITQIPEIVSNYIIYDNSSSRTKTAARFKSLFDLLINLMRFYDDNRLEKHKRVIMYAWMQGALSFFLKWKLSEYNDTGYTADLDQIRDMLNIIPEEDIFSHVLTRKKSPVGYLAVAVRYNDYELAIEIQNSFDLATSLSTKSTKQGDTLYTLYRRMRDGLYDDIRSKRYKISIFAGGDFHSIGGLQRSYMFLTQRLVEMNYCVDMVGWGSCDQSTPLAYPVDPLVNVVFLEREKSKLIYNKTKNYIAESRPDIVLIINSARYSTIIADICIDEKVPYVQSIRGSTEYCIRYLWPDINLIISVFRCAVLNHVLMKSYEGIFREKGINNIISIPSQIEPAQNLAHVQAPNVNGRFVLLYSGRFSVEKRIHYLIQAFNTIKDECEDWDLWLYGLGPLKENLIKIVNELGLSSRVIFGNAQNTDEMYKVYPSAHIMVLPSEQEGCPMALREAMAHGIPVIAYRECSGANEIIIDKLNGLLVEHTEKPFIALAKAIKELISREDLRQLYGDQARITAANYEPHRINSRWERLIRQAILESRSNKLITNLEIDKFQISQYAKSEIVSDSYRFTLDDNLFERYRTDYLICYGRRLFDVEYYLTSYIEVKIAGVDPLLHYISSGWQIGYNPSPLFNTKSYIVLFHLTGDVCPLVHFYKTGFALAISPIHLDEMYFERWPNRRPKHPYNLRSDFHLLNIV